MVQQARQFLRARAMKKGDRCALLAPNSMRWVALDLALMAEGIMVVPLYSRQAPARAGAMMLDALPLRIFCMNAGVAAEIKKLWPGAPHISLIDSVFVDEAGAQSMPIHHEDGDRHHNHLHFGNVGRAEGRDAERRKRDAHAGMHERAAWTRSDGLAKRARRQVFHYLPFCFAASWIVLLVVAFAQQRADALDRSDEAGR